ncbi:MAG: pyridoxamine 5'-phosphate oxidase [Flavobacteriales bacterium]|jgi:pyridoxamine 5'-phosphate oxidase
MKEFLSKLRKDYNLMSLSETDCGSNPIFLLEKWLGEAANAGQSEPNAMTLSTVDASGFPSSRIVLLRDLSNLGLVFYTNYTSEKAKQLDQNDKAALNFFWVEMERQIRVQGRVRKLSKVESDAYFQSRPRLNQLTAWASPQSSSIPDRAHLEALLKATEEKFANSEVIPTPPFWGGYRLEPVRMEFWQGRPGRLHDRIRFLREGNTWEKERLAP